MTRDLTQTTGLNRLKFHPAPNPVSTAFSTNDNRNYLSKVVKWLRADGESKFIRLYRKVIAVALAVFLAASLAGIALLYYGVKEWNHQATVATTSIPTKERVPPTDRLPPLERDPLMDELPPLESSSDSEGIFPKPGALTLSLHSTATPPKSDNSPHYVMIIDEIDAFLGYPPTQSSTDKYSKSIVAEFMKELDSSPDYTSSMAMDDSSEESDIEDNGLEHFPSLNDVD